MVPLPKAAWILTLLCAASGALGQEAAGGPAVNRTLFGTDSISGVTAVTEVFGRGQNVTAAIVEYARPLDADAILPDSFAVEDRTVLSVKVTAEPTVDAQPQDGRFVVITLDPADDASVVFAPGVDDTAAVVVDQTGPLMTADGGTVDPTGTGIINTRLKNLIVDDFRQFRFNDPETGLILDYNLYIPEGGDGSAPVPLVLFMHDGGVTGTNPRRTLQQGLGAVVFASAEDQARHPAFVLAPQYPVPLANDASQTSVYVDVTARLVEHIAAIYPVDRDRVYTTGQSGGCMASIALSVKYPDLFAASLLVAGNGIPRSSGRWRTTSAVSCPTAAPTTPARAT